MKYGNLFIIACVSALGACTGKSSSTTSNGFVPPAAGSIVAIDSMPITENNLNDFSFKVQVKANANSRNGSYTVLANYGVDDAEGSFNMPKDGENLKPLLRKGTEPYTYVIGFQFGNDTMFHDYFEVSAFKVNPTRRAIKMVYLKSYTFE